MSRSSAEPRKPPGGKPVTPALLEAAGLAYLGRFQSSAQHLRRLLLRRVERSARLHGTDAAEGRRQVDALIGRWSASGLLDDRLYAEAKTASLHRRGLPARRIAAKLAEKGLDRDLVDAALASEGREGGDLAAAAALARRRRLGPFRPIETRAAARPKDLAVLARAGFDRRMAEAVLDAEDPETLFRQVAEEGQGSSV